MIKISDIRLDGGTQSRAAINEATVAEYADAMEDQDTVFPPCIVYYDGKSYWLADGFHRVAAWERAGRVEVPAEVRQGDRRAAILHSCGANAAHGLRRTNDDKRRAVMTLLEDGEWANWSDRQIARQCGVSQPFVSKMRTSLSDNGYQMAEARTVVRNGTTYQQNTANIGKREPAETPDAEEQGQPAMSGKEVNCQPKSSEEREESASRQPEETKREPDPQAEARKGLSGLTREGLEDEIVGLRAENAELREKLAMVQVERDRFKFANKDLSSSDHGATISRIQKQLQAAKYARDEAMSATKREEYKRKKAEKELARIMGQEIAL